jgi:enolase
MEAIKNAGHEGKIDIAIDVAASEFYDPKTKNYNMSMKSGKNDRILTPDRFISEVFENMVKKYPVVSIEDPFDQDDFDSYAKMTKQMGSKI